MQMYVHVGTCHEADSHQYNHSTMYTASSLGLCNSMVATADVMKLLMLTAEFIQHDVPDVLICSQKVIVSTRVNMQLRAGVTHTELQHKQIRLYGV